MRFGACIPNYGLETVSATDLRDFCQECQGLGYESLWVTDHVVATPEIAATLGRAFFDTPLSLLYAGMAAPGVRLGFSALVVPYRHPLVLARALTTIDIFSGGRLEVVMGVGWSRSECEALNVPFSERGARTDEALAILRNLWSFETVSYHGRYYNFDDVVFEPKPKQLPPTIWGAGTAERALARTLEFAAGWQGISTHGAANEEFMVRLQAGASARGKSMRLAIRAMDLQFTSATPASRRPFQGTTADVIADVSHWQATGCEEIVLHTLRTASAREALLPLRDFARDVMPRFRESAP